MQAAGVDEPGVEESVEGVSGVSSYVSQDARKIHCVGFADDCYLHVAFPNAENKEAHVERRCNSIFGYLKCPLYPIIAKRFEEETC